MAEIKVFKCGVCGALIDKETGETHVPKDSDAHKFETLKEKYEDAQKSITELSAEIALLKKGGENDSENREEQNGNGDDPENESGILDDIEI